MRTHFLTFLVILFSTCVSFSQEEDEEEKKKLSFQSDFRFRVEQDWNSRNFDGTYREDRFRLRYRFRFGFTYDWNEYIGFGARVRTGVDESVQSPHNNLGHREFSGIPINLDKLYFGGKYDNYWWWAGKNSFPFWKQNELFWDDDVTPEGVAIGATFDNSGIIFKPKFGYFITNTGSGDFDPGDPTNGMIDGHMIGTQMEVGFKANEADLILASGFYSLKNINNVPTTDFYYIGPRFKLDYTFVVTGVKIDLKSKMPITIGFDHFINLEDYDAMPDSLINQVFKDQTNGFVASIQLGHLKNKGDWQFTYFYTRKEEYSVVSYYTEDDWVRFGNINRNRNTNYKGHEFRLSYAFNSNFNIMTRAYFVEGLVTSDVATESGKRVRIDFNMRI